MAKLDNKVAVITGAAVGLGAGIAEVYAKYGAKMCLIDLSKEVEETAERIRKEYGSQVITYVGNVADKAQMKEALDKLDETTTEAQALKDKLNEDLLGIKASAVSAPETIAEYEEDAEPVADEVLIEE